VKLTEKEGKQQEAQIANGNLLKSLEEQRCLEGE
jgi:hypothetical protein